MFKKLKEKITEEVKSSPQRIQQITQSVSDRFQAVPPSEENFFSLTEDDSAPNMSTESGFSNVSLISPSDNRYRRNSNSSMASDVSFLPRYDSASNMYHLQSDLDISASELEDNVSSSSQIGHLSKEQIHSAFQKSQLKYHKYRGRYTDLAKHYKDLERENQKMKSVLVESQDKAIRRLAELKEQCALEKKAKAHLEGALRDEMDEKQLQIEALKTKVDLLQNGSNSSLLSLSNSNDLKDNSDGTQNLENLTKYLNEARQEIETLNSKIQEMKANAIIAQSRENESKEKLLTLDKQILKFSEREKDNNLKLAQSKMEIHTEMLSKEAELNSLKQENEILKHSLDEYETQAKTNANAKLENLQAQNSNLIEKLENLSQKCKTLDSELLKTGQYKIEIQNLTETISTLKVTENTTKSQNEELMKKLNESEKQLVKLEKCIEMEREESLSKLNNVREEAKKALISIESKIEDKIRTEYEGREVELKGEFQQKLESVASDNLELKELQLKVVGSEDIIKKLTKETETLRSELNSSKTKYHDLESNYLELTNDNTNLRHQVSTFEKKISQAENTAQASQDKAVRLEGTISLLKTQALDVSRTLEIQDLDKSVLQKENEKLEEIIDRLTKQIFELEEKISKYNELAVRKQLEEFEEEKIEMLQLIENNKVDMENLKMQHDNAMDYQRECLIIAIKEKETLKEEIDVERNGKRELEQINEDLRKKIAENEDLLDRITREASTLEATTAHLPLLEEKVVFLEEENGRQAKSLTEAREQLEELARLDLKKLKQLQNDLKQTSSQLQIIVEDNLKLNIENQDLVQAKLALEHKLTVLDEKLKLSELHLETIEVDVNESNMLRLKFEAKEKEEKEMRNKLKESVEEKYTLTKKLEELEIERNLISKEKDEYNELYEKNKMQIGDFEIKIGELVKENATAKTIFEKNKKQLETIRSLEDRLKVSESEVSDRSKEFARLELNFGEFQKTCVSEREKLLEEVRVLKEIEEKYHGIFDENQNLKEQISKIDVLEQQLLQFEYLKQEKSGIETSLQSLRNEFVNLEIENKQNYEELIKVKTIEDKLMTVEKEKFDILTRIGTIENDNKLLQVEKESLLDRISELKCVEDKCLILEKEKHILSEELKRLVTIEERHKTLEETELPRLKSIETALDLLKGEKEQLNIELLEIKNSERELQKEKLCLENDKKTFSAQNDKLRIDLKQFENVGSQLEMLESDRINLQSEVNSLQEISRKFNSERSNFENTVAKLKAVESRLAVVTNELDEIKHTCSRLKNDNESLILRNSQISIDNKHLSEENSSLLVQLEESKLVLETSNLAKVKFEDNHNELRNEKDSLLVYLNQARQELETLRDERLNNNASDPELSEIQQNFHEIKGNCDKLFFENKNLKAEIEKLVEKCDVFSKDKQSYESQVNELEHHYGEIMHEKQLLLEELEELKISPVNVQNNSKRVANQLDNLEIMKQDKLLNDSSGNDKLNGELEHLREKLVQYKSLDITNKSSIEFYEGELQKLKNKNDKLNQRLDETLVTLNHCAELSNSTETEYLRNILYNYMLGKESLVLARVIAAVCKFNPHQTETVLQKEQQKQTLVSTKRLFGGCS